MFALVKGTKVIYFAALALLVASLLTLITTVSTPLSSRPVFVVDTTRGTYTFGVLGHCSDLLGCKTALPYDISSILRNATGFEAISDQFTEHTRWLALVPITSGICFFSGILTSLSVVLPLLDISLVASWIAFAVSVAACCCEWILFKTLQNRLEDKTAVTVTWGASHWLILVAAVLLIVAPVIVTRAYVKARRLLRDTGIYEPLRGSKPQPYQF